MSETKVHGNALASENRYYHVETKTEAGDKLSGATLCGLIVTARARTIRGATCPTCIDIVKGQRR